MVDLAAKMDGNVSAAAKLLGKALNDPAEGMAKLKKEGIYLSDEQENMIKHFQSTGNIMAAQKVILNSLGGTYKNFAANVASPMDKMKISIGDIGEEIGKRLFPAFTSVQEVVTSFADAIKNNEKVVNFLFTAVVSITGATLAYKTVIFATSNYLNLLTKAQTLYTTVTKVATFATNGLRLAFTAMAAMNPVGWIALLAGGVVSLMGAFNSMKEEVKDTSKETKAWGHTINESSAFLNSLKVNVDKFNFALDHSKLSYDKVKFAQDDFFTSVFKNQQKYLEMDDSSRESQLKGWVKSYGVLTDEHYKYLKNKESQSIVEAKKDLNREIRNVKIYGSYLKEKEQFDKDYAERKMALDAKNFDRYKKLLLKKLSEEEEAIDLSTENETQSDEIAADAKLEVWAKYGKDESKMNEKELRDYRKTMNRKVKFSIEAKQQEVAEKERMEKLQFDLENNIGTARVDMAKQVLGNLSTLQQSKSREMFEVGKAAAIANTTIATYESATNSYNALSKIPIVGPALGIAAAAAAIAAGMMNVQSISAQTPAFEEGGIMGGTLKTGDNYIARVNAGERISTEKEQKRQEKIENYVDSERTGGRSSIYNDYRRVHVIFKGNSKEQKEMMRDLMKEEKRSKARKDQMVRGRR